MDFYSPAFSVTSDMTEEELDKYFESYVPLSNLPTPPPAKEHAIPSAQQPTSTSTTAPAPELQAYATHLANLVTVTPHRPHIDVIVGFLERADLPDEVVAFAACVLEQLSVRFAGLWRDALVPAEFERELKSFLQTDDTLHCGAHVSPNIIVLAALVLAHGFLVDRMRSSRHWSVKESAGMFSVQEIEATKWAMLKDMDYGLFKISDEHVMSTLAEMQKLKTITPAHKHERRRTLSINLAGAAIWNHGVQTPEPSP